MSLVSFCSHLIPTKKENLENNNVMCRYYRSTSKHLEYNRYKDSLYKYIYQIRI